MVSIWVIDDEESVADVLCGMLQQLGYETRYFRDPREALKQYQPGKADVLITDIRMPSMDGLEFTRSIRQCDPRAVVILITGFPSVSDAVEAIKMGAADYLTKPFRMEEIRMRVLRALEARDLEQRLRRNRALTWLLIGSLPVWFLLGLFLAFSVSRP